MYKRQQFRRGLISNAERSAAVLKIWDKATNDVTAKLQSGLDRYNPIYMMADSGARGSMSQIRQLAGMRGLIANTLSLIHISSRFDQHPPGCGGDQGVFRLLSTVSVYGSEQPAG